MDGLTQKPVASNSGLGAPHHGAVLFGLLGLMLVGAYSSPSRACSCAATAFDGTFPANGAIDVPLDTWLYTTQGLAGYGATDVSLLNEEGEEVALEQASVWLPSGVMFAARPVERLRAQHSYRLTVVTRSDGRPFTTSFSTGSAEGSAALQPPQLRQPPVVTPSPVSAYFESSATCGGPRHRMVLDVEKTGVLTLIRYPAFDAPLSSDHLDDVIEVAAPEEEASVDLSVQARPEEEIELASGPCRYLPLQPGEPFQLQLASLDLTGQISPWSEVIEVEVPYTTECACTKAASRGGLPWTAVMLGVGRVLVGRRRPARRRVGKQGPAAAQRRP